MEKKIDWMEVERQLKGGLSSNPWMTFQKT